MSALLLREKGQSLVEIALVVPLLLIFLLALWQFLVLFQAKVVLEHYSYELARVAATHNGSLKEASPVFNRLKQALKVASGSSATNLAAGLQKTTLTVQVKLRAKVKLLPGLAAFSGIFGQNFVNLSAVGLFVKEPYLSE